MSIGLVVTRGFSNGTLVGTIKDLVTMGYTIGEFVVVVSTTIGTKYNITFNQEDRNIVFDTDERAVTFNQENRDILL